MALIKVYISTIISLIPFLWEGDNPRYEWVDRLLAWTEKV